MKTTLDKKESVKNSLKSNKDVKTSLGQNINDGVESSKACPFCGCEDFVIEYSRSEVLCKSCGCVLEENIIDFTPSGTSINREGRNLNQNGAPCSITKHDKGLSTSFDLKHSPKYDRAKWIRLRRLQNQSFVSGSPERNLSRALNELSSLISRMSLPKDVQKEAAAIYRKALRKDLVRGRSISLLIAASLYAACRVCKVPRTLDEVAEVSGINKKTLGKSYRFISRELSLNLMPTSPVDYIPRFADKLDLPSDVEVKSIEIISKAKDLGLIAGKRPNGVAAAALYCSSRLIGPRRTQGEIARAVGVTEVTIRTIYKEIVEGLNLFE